VRPLSRPIPSKADEHDVPTGGSDLDDFLRGLSDEDIVELKLDLQEDLGDIKEQLSAARRLAASTGNYSDSDWFRRAESAQRVKANQYNSCCAEQGRRNREHREKNIAAAARLGLPTNPGSPRGGDDFTRAFYRAAKKLLPAEMVGQLRACAEQILEEDLA
jgi:hypothetical protein